MNHMETKFRVSSRSYTKYNNLKTYVGRVRFYENDRFLFSESTGIHRLTPTDAKLDAYKIAEDRMDGI